MKTIKKQVKRNSQESEQIAYWYLRLNGFLTIPNFIVHSDEGSNQRTDVDILGIRFPFRQELPEMKDDNIFLSKSSSKPLIAIVEVKSGMCNINYTWTQPNHNIEKVLKSLGMFPLKDIDNIARSLYKYGYYEESPLYNIFLICIGKHINEDIKHERPNVLQITWEQVLEFIYSRFQQFKLQKASHGQWDGMGHKLMDAIKDNSYENFKKNIGYNLIASDIVI